MKNLSATSNRPAQSKTTKVIAPSTPRRKLYLAIAAQLLALSTPVWAGPEGGVVVGGSGTIKQSDLNTTITQNTDRLAIDWNSFNVDANERVTFIQPTQNSVALNRILGGDTSRILGQIDANGHVVLMNPNGILFGKGSTINVGGLVASGLSMDPNQFMNGDFALKAVEGSDGAVVNAGIINAATGGNVVLVGQHVDNQGFISAKLGSVTLAAGKASILSFDSNGLIGVKVTEATLHDQIGVQNSGSVQSEGGQVLLTSSVSQDIFTKAVNAGDLSTKSSVVMHDDGSFTLGDGADVVNTGIIDVSSDNSVGGRVVVLGQNVTNEGSILADSLNPRSNNNAGSIELHAVDTTLVSKVGKVSASTSKSGTGGDIKILGNKVGLLDQATVYATGAIGGGSILVGGDKKGENALIRNAEFVHVDKDANINASATANGDGGTVIAFAENTTRIYGGLSARGGNDGGDGGFIETSGKSGFVLDSTPDTSAANGTAGTWLIDPYTVYIGAPTSESSFDLNGGRFTPTNEGAVISTLSIETAFATNNNVIINTGSGGSGEGLIHVVSGLSVSARSGQTLTLDSAGDIRIDNDISTNGGNIVFVAGGQATFSGDVSTNGGNIDLTLPAGIDANQVLFDTTGGTTGTGDINITGSGFFSLPSINAKGSANIKSDTFAVQLGGDITVGGSLKIEAPTNSIAAISPGYKLVAGQDISLTASNTIGTDFDLDAGRDIFISYGAFNTQFVIANTITSGGTTKIHTETSDINIEGGLLSAGTLLQLDSGGDINIRSDISQNGAIDFIAGGNIALANSNIITIGDATFSADSVIFSSPTEAGNITVEGNLTVTATNSISSLIGSITTTNGNISLTSGGTLALSSNIVTSTGNFTVDVANAFDYGPSASIDTRGGQFIVNVGSLVANPFMLGPSDTTPFNPLFNSGSGDMVIQSRALGTLSLPNIQGNNLTATSADDLNFASSNIDVTGNIALTSTNGNIRYENRSGNYSIAADGDILLSAKNRGILLQEPDFNIFVTVDAGNDLTMESGQSIFLDSSFTANGVTRISSAIGDVNYYNGVLNPKGGLIVNGIDINFDLDVITNNADFIATATNGITLNGAVTLGGGNATLTAASSILSNNTIDAGGGNVTLTSTNSAVSTSDIVNASKVELSASSGAINLTSIAASDLIINYLSTINQDSAGALIVTGNTQIVARGGSNSFAFLNGANQLNTLSLDVQQNGASPLTLTEIDGFTLSTSTISDLLTVNTPSLILEGDIRGAAGSSSASIAFDNANSIGKTLTISPNTTLQNLSVVLGDGDDTINIAASTPILIDAGSGNDTFNITAANVVSRLDGGAGSNAINLLNNSAADWNITGVDSGGVSQGSGDITFVNIASIYGSSGDDTFSYTEGGSISGFLSGGAGNDTLSMAATTTDRVWLLNRSGNGDEMTDSNSVSLLKFDTIESLIGGTGNDVFRAYGISDVQSINGGSAGNDSLRMIVDDATTIFSVAPTGVIFNLKNSTASLFLSDSTQNILNFSNIGTFFSGTFSPPEFYGSHVISDDQNHNWKISTSNTGSLDVNILELIDDNGKTLHFNGISTFEAGTGTDTFDTTAIARDFSWSMNSDNSVLVNGGADQYAVDSLTLSGFENFKTGDGINTFDIASGVAIGNIEAGAGNDIFTLGDNVTIAGTLDGGAGSNVITLLNNSAANWNITGIDSGDVSQGSGDITFINIGNIYGSDGDDTFSFTDSGSISGLLSGGAGYDTLSMANTSTDWNWLLSIGSREEVSDSNGSFVTFDTIESVIGGTGNDSFSFGHNSSVESIDGGSAGDDYLSISTIAVDFELGVIFNLRNSTVSFSSSDSTQTILNFSNIREFESGVFSPPEFYGSHVISDDQDYNWKISTSNTGSFDKNILEIIDSTGQSRIFKGVTTFEAGTGTDTFDTTAIARDFSWSMEGNNSALVNGGADQYLMDSLTLSGFENFRTGDGINTFDIASGVAIGNIEAGAGNDIFTFGSDVSALSLLTGDGDDSVTLGDKVTIAGALDGGAGNDILDISAFTSAIEINFITGASSTGLLNQNFETEILPTTGSTLFGGDFKTDWLLLDDDTITVTAYNPDGSINKTSNFTQTFETLKGGSGVNSFQLASTKNFDGEIQGDTTGSNTLTGGDLINNWIIDGQNSGSVQEQGSAITTIFSNIGTIIGGTNTDTLTGYSSATDVAWSVDKNLGGSIADGTRTFSFENVDSLVGGDGDDTFNISAQISKISGGSGANVVNVLLNEDLKWQLNTSNGSVESSTLKINFDGIQRVYADALAAKSTFFLNDLGSVVKDISAADSTNAIVCFCGMGEPVILDLNDATRQFNNIDSYEGNEAGSQLIGKNIDSQWTINPADGSLRLVDGNSTIKFIDFETFKAGSGIDTLTATGSSSNSWAISGDNAGNVNDTFIFSGIENLSGGAGADTFTFSDNASIGDVLGNDGDDTFILANNITFTKIDGGVGNGIDTLNTGGRDSILDYQGNTTVNALLVNPINIENVVTGTGGITFSGGDGANTWLINADGSGTLTKTDIDPGTYTFSNVSSVLGGKDNDDFILATGGSLKNGIVGGGGANDSLTTQNAGDNTWVIDATNSGNVTTADGTTLFSQIATLVGGSGNDSFELVTGGSLTGSADGAGGEQDKFFTISTDRSAWDLAQTSGFDVISDGALGPLVSFENIEVVSGVNDTYFIHQGTTTLNTIAGVTAGNDDFNFISGYTGLNVNAETSELKYFHADGSLSDAIAFSNIQGFRRDASENSSFENTYIGQFIAPNSANDWLLSAPLSDTSLNAVTLTSGTKTIDVYGDFDYQGGTGIDTLTGYSSATGLTWTVDSEFSGSIIDGPQTYNFTNIEKLIGGDGGDTFNISAQINSISGGAGTNQIVSGLSADQIWQLNANDGLLTATGINVAFDGIQQVYASGIDNNVTFFLNDLNSEVVSIGSDLTALSTLSFANVNQPVVLNLNDIGRQVIGIDTFDGNTGSQLIGPNVDSLWLADSTDGSLVTVTAGRGVNFTNFASFTGGTGVDTLTTASADNSWLISATNSGTLNSSFAFSGIENISGGSGTDTFTFADNASIGDVLGNDGDDTFVMANNVAVNLLDGGLGNDTLDIGNLNSVMDYLGAITVGQVNLPTESIEQTLSGTGTGSLTLYGGDTDSAWLLGADGSVTITKAGVDYVFDGSSNVSAVLGGLGNDDFTLVQGANLSGGINGGSSSNDSLTVQGTDDVQWTIDKQDGGSFTSNGITMSFAEIATLAGGTGTDSFELLANGSISGSVDGGTGSDTLTANNGVSNNWYLGEDAVSGLDRLGQTEVLARFKNIETLIGVDQQVDVFEFFDNKTDVQNIDGGTVANLQNTVSSANSEFLVNLDESSFSYYLANGTLSNAIQLEQINSFSNTAANLVGSTLIAENAENEWTMTDSNAGAMIGEISTSGRTVLFSGFDAITGGGAVDTLNVVTIDNSTVEWSVSSDNTGKVTFADNFFTFSGIENLIGSDSDDTFNIFSSGIQNIDGGAGTNTLIGGDQINNWDVTEDFGGLFNATNFVNIQNLVGGSAKDTFYVYQTMNIGNIQAGAGDDFVTLDLNASAQNILMDDGDDTVRLLEASRTGGVVDGGIGQDTLDMGAFGSAIELDFLTGLTSSGLEGLNFEFTSLPSEGSAIFGGDLKTDWKFLNGDSFEITAYNADGSVAKTRIFNDHFSLLRGGSGDNNFELASAENYETTIRATASANNTLSGSDLINDWIIDGVNSGRVQEKGGSVATVFENIGNIIGSDTANDTFTFMAGGSVKQLDGGAGTNNHLVIEQNVAANWTIGTGNDQVSLGSASINFSNIKSIEGSLGADTFNIGGAASGVTTIDARGGSDTFDISGLSTPSIVNLQTQTAVGMTIAGFEFFAAAGTGNQIIGLDAQASWSLSSANAGVINYQNGTSQISYTGFASVVGGADIDQFMLAGTTAPTLIDGGAGSDSLTTGNTDNTWLLDNIGGTLNGKRFESIETINAGNGQDSFSLTSASVTTLAINAGLGENSLAGFNQTNDWQIGNSGNGTLNTQLSFSGIQHFVGGSGIDNFTVQANTTLKDIYAGAGNDTLTIGADSTVTDLYGEAGDDTFIISPELTLLGVMDGGTDGEVAGDTIDLSQYQANPGNIDIETLVGFVFGNFKNVIQPPNDGSYFGGNGTNIWYITGEDEGRLEVIEGSNIGSYNFSGIHTLLGGTGSDTFVFETDAAAITQKIEGGAGGSNNTLDLSAQALVNQWLIDGQNSGKVTNSANPAGNIFTNIASIIGGSNIDTLKSDTAGDSTWRIAGVDQGVIEIGTSSANFKGIENLQGGQGRDQFILGSVGQISGTIDGSEGVDRLSHIGTSDQWLLNTSDNAVTGTLLDGTGDTSMSFIRVEQISGEGSNDQLIAANQDNNSWNVGDSVANAYINLNNSTFTQVAFEGMEQLVGGSANDVFTVVNANALPTSIDGGLGSDTVNLQTVAQNLDIALGTVNAGQINVLQLTNVNVLNANANQIQQILGANDQGYTWTIDSQNSGTVTTSIADANHQDLRFNDVKAVIGGDHDDIFQVTATTGISLDGGAARTADFVDYSQVNANVSINLANSLNGGSGLITGIEGIRGNNSGADSLNTAELIGSNTNNVWTITDFDGAGIADGVNDGQFSDGNQTISFIDFNVLTGGSGSDTFNQSTGIIEGKINGGAGNDTLNITLSAEASSALNNRGTQFNGGGDNDRLNITGGSDALKAAYTATANGGKFDYREIDSEYVVSHSEVELINDQTRARTFEIIGSNNPDNLALAESSFSFNQLASVNYGNKDNVIIRSSVSDTVELVENISLAGSLTLVGGNLVTYDSSNTSITAKELILDGTQNVGASTSRIRTSIDSIVLSDTQGDIYLQEQNGLNIAAFNTNSDFDVSLVRGDLTSTTALESERRFTATALDGNITLNQHNRLAGDIVLNASDTVTLNSDITIKLAGVNADTLLLQSGNNIEQSGPITVSDYTYLDAANDIVLDNAKNDFNRISISAGGDVTVVDQNTLQLFGVDVDGHLRIKAEGLNIDNSVTANTLELDGGTGSVIMTKESSVNAVGNINVTAEQNIVVSVITGNNQVNLGSSKGEIIDGNGESDNISAKELIVNVSQGVGKTDAIETTVAKINVNTTDGNVGINNTGSAEVDSLKTSNGNIDFNSTGNVSLAGGAVKAGGDNMGNVSIGSTSGDVKQTGDKTLPAIESNDIVIVAPNGDFGAGGFKIVAPTIRVKAEKQVGELITPPGTTRDAQFSGTFKFEDQLLVVEHFEDISPAIFSNVKGYFYNDISLKLSADQLDDDDDEDDEE